MKKKLAALTVIAIALLLFNACSPQSHRTWSGMISSTAVIAAPPEKVFAYVADWNNQLQWDPGLKGIYDAEGSGLGYSYRWKYDFGGATVEGRTVQTDFVLNQRIVEKSFFNHGFETVTWLFLPHPQGTRLIRVYEGSIQPLPPELQKMSDVDILADIQKTDDDHVNQIKEEVEKK